jgi:hypothetical protein
MGNHRFRRISLLLSLTAFGTAGISLVMCAPKATWAQTAAPASSRKLLPVRAQPARVFAGVMPADWQAPAFDDRPWTSAPGVMAPRAAFAPGVAAPAGVTAVDVFPGSALYTRTHFDVDDIVSARCLELRITYQDGFIAYLNGIEVARRNVPTAPVDARPRVAHGAEPELIFLALPQKNVALSAKDNVLAVEIRPAAGRAPLDTNAPVGQIGIAAVSGVRIVRGPYLIAPSERAVSVAWETDIPARGEVLFQSATGGTERRVAARVPALRQALRLTGLVPGQSYRYDVHVEGASQDDRAQSEPATFVAAPAADRPLRFIVYGDMRAPGHAAHAQVVAGILREHPSLVLNTGDLVAVGGEESAWQRYFEITAAMGAVAPVAPALGNHEAYVGGSAKSWALFGLKSAASVPGTGYTSFDWGGAHFVIIDSNHPDRAQRDWLERDLAAAHHRHARAIFTVLHDGPWSHGVHGGSRTMERTFAPVMAAGGVDVLFSGHDHLYERGVGSTPRGTLPYVVSGGGGAPLYNPSCQPPGGPPTTIPPPPAVAAPGKPPVGLTGAPLPLPACPSSVAIVQKTYHYIVVEVGARTLRLCAHRPDGDAIEPCVEFPLRAHRR